MTIKDVDHLTRLVVQMDMVLADGKHRTILEIVEALIGKDKLGNADNPECPDNPLGSAAEWHAYADYCQRNGYTPTDVMMALRSAKFPSGWGPDDLEIQRFAKRKGATL